MATHARALHAAYVPCPIHIKFEVAASFPGGRPPRAPPRVVFSDGGVSTRLLSQSGDYQFIRPPYSTLSLSLEVVENKNSGTCSHLELFKEATAKLQEE